MTYQELVEKVKKAYESANAKKITEHVTVQVNVEGEAEGIFYLEVAEGNVKVEPYDYYGHDVLVIAPAAALVDIAAGKLDVEEAYTSGKIRVEGNLGKAALLKQIKVKKAATKKTTTTKSAEKKAAPSKKTTAKTAAKTTETKSEEKKAAPAKKATVAKKAEAKAEETAKKAEVKEDATKKVAETKTEVKAEAKETVKKATTAKKTATKKASATK